MSLPAAGEGEMHWAVPLSLGFAWAEPGVGEKGGFCFVFFFQAAGEINVEGVLVSFLFKSLGKKHVSEFSCGRSILAHVEKGMCS